MKKSERNIIIAAMKQDVINGLSVRQAALKELGSINTYYRSFSKAEREKVYKPQRTGDAQGFLVELTAANADFIRTLARAKNVPVRRYLRSIVIERINQLKQTQ